MKRFLLLWLVPLAVAAADWTPLFNGKNLDGWTPKIKGCPLGENFKDTFRVENGVLRACYDKYEKFDNRFGHLFWRVPLSNYVLRVEYRFVGEQTKGGPGWAFRNSGVMIHCPHPETMTKDQDFPVSIEVQLLGGPGKGQRTTANICSPGTHIVMDGKLITQHCINSKSKTYHGDQWVTVEIEVRADGSSRHIIEGQTVFEYTEPQLDEKDANARKLIESGADRKLRGGYISLQAESHPLEFRKVEVRPLGK
jgi:hypothetical protein